MRRNGFTLIELLVVIAIIGILAAIIFPVYAQARKGAYKSSDLSNMNALRTALQLYKADTGAYPPALLGYVGPYSNLAANGNALPPNAIRDALYPKRVESLAVFRPALHRISDAQGETAFDGASAASGANGLVVSAFWPQATLATATNDARDQRYGPSDLVHRVVQNPNDPTSAGCQVVPNVYYKISGYDAAPVGPTGTTYETHYQLFWSAFAVPAGLGGAGTAASDCSGVSGGDGNGGDTPRQLGYTDPPETTVVTWNPFFRDYQNGAPLHQRQDLVLFLAGNARPMDSANVDTQAWAIQP